MLSKIFGKKPKDTKTTGEIDLPCLLVDAALIEENDSISYSIVDDLVNKVLKEALSAEDYFTEVARSMLLYTMYSQKDFIRCEITGGALTVSRKGTVNVYRCDGDLKPCSEDLEVLIQESLDNVKDDYEDFASYRWRKDGHRHGRNELDFLRLLVNPSTDITLLGKVKMPHTPLKLKVVRDSETTLDFFIAKDRVQSWLLSHVGLRGYLEIVVLQMLATSAVNREKGDVVTVVVTEADCLIKLNVVTGSLEGSVDYVPTKVTLDLLEEIKAKGLFDRGRVTKAFKKFSGRTLVTQNDVSCL